MITKKYSLLNLIKKCPTCKKQFKPTRKEYLYCSVKCGAIASRKRKGQYLVIKCSNCGTKFHRKKSQVDKTIRQYCSKKCYSQHKRKLLKGKANPNWKNGISFVKSGVSGKATNYRRGRYYENKTRKRLEAKGCHVTRSAASKGLFDIIGICPTKIYLIEVKSGSSRLSPAKRKELKEIKVPSNCVVQHWLWRGKGIEPEIKTLNYGN